jgi:hypothetical protein
MGSRNSLPRTQSQEEQERQEKVIISITAIDEYFARPETPAANSPVGVLMVKVIAKNPRHVF